MAETEEPEKPAPKFVWWSTEESVKRGTVSVLACAEVAAGIYLYWWLIPAWFDTTFHLLVSIIIAPFLLLRSPQSITDALTAFKSYTADKVGFLSKFAGAAALVLIAGCASGLIVWVFAVIWLDPYEGGSLYWRSAVAGWVGMQVGVAVVIASAGALAGAMAVTVFLVSSTAGALSGPAVIIVAVAMAGTGLMLGMWCRSVFEKIKATLHHMPKGWFLIAKNWRELVIAQDFCRPPELLPGIECNSELSHFTVREIARLDENARGAERVFYLSIEFLAYVILFLPVWLYRLSLKSTCWFWWPLVFAQGSGRKAALAVSSEGGPEKAAARFEQQGKTWAAGFLALLSALLVLHAFGLIPKLTLPVPGVKDGLDLYASIGQMSYLLLPCAVVQAEFFLRANFMHPRAAANDLGQGHRRLFTWSVALRNFLLWTALLIGLALVAAEWVPVLEPFANFVETRYLGQFPLGG